MQQIFQYCQACNAVTPHTRPTPNYLMHIAFVVVTGGLWLGILLLMSLSPRKYDCQGCIASNPFRQYTSYVPDEH